MLKFRFPLSTDKDKVTEQELLIFYRCRLLDFKRYLYNNLSNAKLSGINRELLNLLDNQGLINKSKISSESTFTYRILNYAIQHLKLFRESSGVFYYSFEPKLLNPFCTGLTFDHLLRLIEFGHERIKPLKLFRHSFMQLEEDALKLFNTQYGWRKELKK